MSLRRIAWLFVLLIAVFPFCEMPRAHAQNVYATIHGTVTDPSGAVVPNAQVTALNTSTGIHTAATTDSKGYYTFTQLQIGGPYTVSVVASGFQRYEKTGLNLTVGSNPFADVTLQVGSNSQTIQVAAAAVQVSTADTELKTDITATQVEQMPLLGRDASILEKSATGVVEAPDRFGNFESDGAQSQQNEFTLDGIDVNDVALQDQAMYPNPDALAEFTVVQNDLDPQYSRNSGAMVAETLKSGTNAFHGDGFEFYRDTFMNDGGWGDVSGRPEFHQNTFGGTLGGPILRNKLFFFTAYQGFRNRSGAPQPTTVFSPAQHAGNFSADKNQSTEAANSAGLSSNPMPFAVDGCAKGTAWNACPAFAGGTVNIPTSMWNPEAAALVSAYVPASNETEVANGFTSYIDNFNTADSALQDQGIIRADFHPTQNDTLWASSLFQSSPDVQQLPFGGANLPGFTQVDASHIKMFNADYTHTFNATTLNDFRAGYFRFNYAAVNPQTITPPSSAGFNISPQSSIMGLPNMSLNGYFTLGFSSEGPQPRKDTNLLGSDTFTKILGNHSLKFGAQYEQFGVENPYYADNNGSYGYNGNGSYSSGDPAIDFVLGIPDTYVQASGSIIDAISHEYYVFGQDSWKVSRDVVLNYGIGWDAETPWANHQYAGHGITCWSLGNQTSTIYPGGPPGLQYSGDPGCSTYGQASTHWRDFAPRFGFDWSPSSGPSALIGDAGSHNFSVRGGFGIFYNRDSEEEALQNLSSPPYFFESHGAADLGGSPAFLNPFSDITGNAAASEGNPFPYHLPPFGQALNWSNYPENDMSNVSAQYLPSYAYNMFLGVQRALPGSMVLSVQYVGSLGRKLPRVGEGDPVTPAGHTACLANASCAGNLAAIHLLFPQYTAQPAVVPGSVSAAAPNGIPWYLSVGEQLSNGTSSYSSLQVSLEKAVSHGLYFKLAYTYGHALDDDSGYESASGGGAFNAQGAENGRAVNFIPGFEYLNYGSSDYDARQRLSILYNYEVPLLASMRNNHIINEALGGWNLSGTTALQTGFPVNISEAGYWQNGWCDEYTYYSCPDVPQWTGTRPRLSNPRTSTGNVWFDTSQFSPETPGSFGNTPRNFFRGPGYNYSDMSLYKNFHLNSESRYIELRLESYNVFNHANFAEPDGNLSDTTFGVTNTTINPTSFGTQAGDPQPGRATQLGAKFYF